MGKIVEEKKKKKKGRPSLLDLQKRNLKQQQQQQQQQLQTQNPKPNNPYSKPIFGTPIAPNPNRRFTRRNPNPDGTASGSDRIEAEEDDVDDDENDSNGKRREKQLKVVHRVSPNQQNQRSSVNSLTLNSGSYGNDSNNGEENDNGETPHKKRKFNAVGDGSAQENGEKGEKRNPTSKSKDTLQGTVLESGPTTPLPDQALLVFILDRLQKKDTYGVFSEPVDPEELPDYHEIIVHPMDFGTVRKKLSSGAYANLEQFEDDVFLICTNAMQYNSSDTIYFRQARSIHELAKKNFENLRQDSDDNEPEHKPEHKAEHKIVRRGRPPTKNLKKPLGRPPIERAGSEFSDATLATGGDNTNWSNSHDLRKGPLSDKSGSADAPGRTLRGNRNNEGHNNLSGEHRSERDDDFPGFTLKGTMKLGKKQLVFDENRRNTYKLSHQSAGGREPSVLTTFDGEKKLLMAVGLHTEHGFARSLARFAANLGPIAWKVASKKIERALPTGTKFGPGWVGENEALPPQSPSVTPLPPRALPPQPAPSLPKVSPSSTPYVVESKGEKSSVKHEASYNNSSSDVLPTRNPHPSTMAASSSVTPNKSFDPSAEPVETARGLNYGGGGFSLMSHNSGGIRPNPPFQVHQNPGFNRPVNGLSGGGFGFNIASQMAKLVRPTRPTVGSFGSQASMQSPMAASVTRSNNNSIQSIPASQSESEDPSKLSGNSNTINSSTSLPDSSNHEARAGTGSVPHHPQPSWQGLSPHQKADSVPPDLNVRFQSPGSPNSTVRVDSPQPDLALQL